MCLHVGGFQPAKQHMSHSNVELWLCVGGRICGGMRGTGVCLCGNCLFTGRCPGDMQELQPKVFECLFVSLVCCCVDVPIAAHPKPKHVCLLPLTLADPMAQCHAVHTSQPHIPLIFKHVGPTALRSCSWTRRRQTQQISSHKQIKTKHT